MRMVIGAKDAVVRGEEEADLVAWCARALPAPPRPPARPAPPPPPPPAAAGPRSEGDGGGSRSLGAAARVPDGVRAGAPPPPTVAPTRVPTVHSLRRPPWRRWPASPRRRAARPTAPPSLPPGMPCSPAARRTRTRARARARRRGRGERARASRRVRGARGSTTCRFRRREVALLAGIGAILTRAGGMAARGERAAVCGGGGELVGGRRARRRARRDGRAARGARGRRGGRARPVCPGRSRGRPERLGARSRLCGARRRLLVAVLNGSKGAVIATCLAEAELNGSKGLAEAEGRADAAGGARPAAVGRKRARPASPDGARAAGGAGGACACASAPPAPNGSKGAGGAPSEPFGCWALEWWCAAGGCRAGPPRGSRAPASPASAAPFRSRTRRARAPRRSRPTSAPSRSQRRSPPPRATARAAPPRPCGSRSRGACTWAGTYQSPAKAPKPSAVLGAIALAPGARPPRPPRRAAHAPRPPPRAAHAPRPAPRRAACVDAPPLVASWQWLPGAGGAGGAARRRQAVIVGSHAHRVACVSLRSGALRWETRVRGHPPPPYCCPYPCPYCTLTPACVVSAPPPALPPRTQCPAARETRSGGEGRRGDRNLSRALRAGQGGSRAPRR